MGATFSFFGCLTIGAVVGGSHISVIEGRKSFHQRFKIYGCATILGCIFFLFLLKRCTVNDCGVERDDGLDLDAWGSGFLLGLGGMGILANYSNRGTASDPDRNFGSPYDESVAGIALSQSQQTSYEPVTLTDTDDQPVESEVV